MNRQLLPCRKDETGRYEHPPEMRYALSRMFYPWVVTAPKVRPVETAPDRYRRLRTAFAATIEGVPQDRWLRPSPCEGWTARDVVAHVVETQEMFERLVGRRLEPGPDVADDPAGAFRAATDQVQTHLDDPVTADVEYDGAFGPEVAVSADASEQDRLLAFLGRNP